MKTHVISLWRCPVCVLVVILIASLGALASALIAQFAFDLQPCVLCLYQRVPFVAAAVFATAGLAIRPLRMPVIILSALTFAANTVIAAYHVGVEQRWWSSFFEGCKIPSTTAGSSESLLDAVMSAPSVPCTDIAWQDPIFGASMAVYNVLLCAGMVGFCGTYFLLRKLS